MDEKDRSQVHVVLRPGWEEEAVPGNKVGNAAAFDMAALLLREQAPFPPDLANWLATRLAAAAASLRAGEDPAKHLPAAMQLSAGRGRPSKGAKLIARDRELVWDTLELLRSRGEPGRPGFDATMEDIFVWVADRRRSGLKRITEELTRRNAAEISELQREGKASADAKPKRVTPRGLTVNAATVEDAWKRRRDLLPEYFRN